MSNHTTPGGVRSEALTARTAVVRAATRAILPVRAQCDRCGELTDRTDGGAVAHVLRYPSHTVSAASLTTTVYRHPTRVRKES